MGGISRFILLWSVVAFLLLGSAIDSIWNTVIKQYQRRHPYKILVVYETVEKREVVIQQLQDTQYSVETLAKKNRS